MKIKKLNSKQIDVLRKPRTYIEKGNHIVKDYIWIEGVDLVGFWDEGQSYVFEHGGTYICISFDFLWELIKDTSKK